MAQVDDNDTSRGFLLRGLPNAGRGRLRAPVRACGGGRHRTTLNDLGRSLTCQIRHKASYRQSGLLRTKLANIVHVSAFSIVPEEEVAGVAWVVRHLQDNSYSPLARSL